LLVSRDELCLVLGTGPRGDPAQRHRTRQHPIAVQVGPYHVRGYVHALPGSDPVASFHRRKPMVPLTDAWFEYSLRGDHMRRRSSNLLVNRELTDWVVEAVDEEVAWPELPLPETVGPLVKDFTGDVHFEPVDAVGEEPAVA
jgi:hypothetical protein